MAGIFERINRMVGNKASEELSKRSPDGVPRANPGLEAWMKEAKGGELKGEIGGPAREVSVDQLLAPKVEEKPHLLKKVIDNGPMIKVEVQDVKLNLLKEKLAQADVGLKVAQAAQEAANAELLAYQKAKQNIDLAA